jgi:hypothetical protein
MAAAIMDTDFIGSREEQIEQIRIEKGSFVCYYRVLSLILFFQINFSWTWIVHDNLCYSAPCPGFFPARSKL